MKKKWFSYLVIISLFLSCSDDNTSNVVSNGGVSNQNGNGGNSNSEKIFTGFVNLTTQSQVDNFGANNYTQINGSVFLQSSAINNLSSLSSIKVINGNLRIVGTRITNLDPLSGVEIYDDTVEGLSYLDILNNENLENIDGLKSADTGLDSIQILNNPLLSNIDGLERMVETVYIVIGGNNSLANLNGLSNLVKCKSIDIRSNSKVENLDPLINLTEVIDSVIISNNESLRDFCGLTLLLNTTNLSEYIVYSNFYNPTEEDIMNGDCSI